MMRSLFALLLVGIWVHAANAACPDPTLAILRGHPAIQPGATPREQIRATFTGTGCLYDSIVDAWTHESLDTHTLKVAAQFEDQRRFFDLARIERNLGINLSAWMQHVIALHDIGKPLALQLYGSSEQQTVFNRPLLLSILMQLGYSDRETQLADALVSHDILGEFVQKKRTIEDADTLLRTRLALAGFENAAPEYFQLQLLYYISDATAHDWIRVQFFETDENGRLWPKDKEPLLALMARWAQ